MKQVLDVLGHEVELPIGPTVREFRESMEASGHFAPGSVRVTLNDAGRFDVEATFMSKIRSVRMEVAVAV